MEERIKELVKDRVREQEETVKVFMVLKDRFEIMELPKSLIEKSVIMLREEGPQVVETHEGKSMLVEGMYIPAKGSKVRMLHINGEGLDKEEEQ